MYGSGQIQDADYRKPKNKLFLSDATPPRSIGCSYHNRTNQMREADDTFSSSKMSCTCADARGCAARTCLAMFLIKQQTGRLLKAVGISRTVVSTVHTVERVCYQSYQNVGVLRIIEPYFRSWGTFVTNLLYLHHNLKGVYTVYCIVYRLGMLNVDFLQKVLHTLK